MTTCVYCGEEEATETMLDPNNAEGELWDVCKTCGEVISVQMNLSLWTLVGNEEKARECNLKLEKISRKTGKAIMSASIVKEDKRYNIIKDVFD